MYTFTFISYKYLRLFSIGRSVCCAYRSGYFAIPETALSTSTVPMLCPFNRHFTSSGINLQDDKAKKHKSQLMHYGYFNTKNKNRETFLEVINMYRSRERKLRGHVEFILAALQHLEEFGVHKDLEIYKSLLDIMPKGEMVPVNVFQQEFVHYPKHQDCALDVLQEMELHGVMPDTELQNLLKNIFGFRGRAFKKVSRMLYWMPKFKHSSPWPLPEVLPHDAVDLAKLAMAQICSIDPASKITLLETADVKDSIDDTWILNCISPTQKELIKQLPKNEPIKVEGPFGIFLKDQRISYFILRAEAKPPPAKLTRSEIDDVKNLFVWMNEESKEGKELIKVRSVHEQDDGIILAMCATGTSSRDSLLSWIRLLEKSNPDLNGITVLFTQSSPIGDVIVSNPNESSSENSIEKTTDF